VSPARSLALAALAAVALALAACGGGDEAGPPVSDEPLAFAWPPTAGERYPDLELLDFRGAPVRLSDFEGRVLLIEPVGMT
jgi:cytochrome oxidase Cu insertion factor (SCO1/SenC/PrrC family)